MSLHAQLSPEALAKLHKQQRNSTITSIIISVLIVILLGIILLFILLPQVDNFTPEIVSYQSGKEDDEKPDKREMSRHVERKPSAPSSSMAKVIAANTTSPTAIPVPETEVPDPSTDFGNGDDFGDGWGDGSGFGGGGGGSFFGVPIKGDRILYIIDYSASMSGLKAKLMRAELAKSVYKLPHDKKYQMIFFAGPVWVAGNGVSMKGHASAVISGKGGHKFKWTGGKGAGNWKENGKKQKPEWLQATDSSVKKSRTLVQKSKLIWGTNWENPLAMAFRMKPLPNVIIFMTDGVAPGNPIGIATKYAALAKKNHIIINSIALMEPKAAKAMSKLATGTGGQFSLINAKGKKVGR